MEIFEVIGFSGLYVRWRVEVEKWLSRFEDAALALRMSGNTTLHSLSSAQGDARRDDVFWSYSRGKCEGSLYRRVT